MSSVRQGLPGGLTPPPLPPSTPGKRARIKARTAGKPPPVEFLAEEFVLEDVEDYEELPSELLIEEESNVVFAGPSDFPPAADMAAPVPSAAASPWRAGGDVKRWGRVRMGSLSVAACLALIVAMT